MNPIEGFTGVRLVGYAKALAYAGIACVLCLVFGLAAGLWAGNEWQQGRQAQREVKTIRAEVADALGAVREAQAATVQISRDAEHASASLNAASKGLSDDLERNRLTAAAASQQLERAIARDPDAAGCRATAEFMQAWNAANRGDPAGRDGAGESAPADRPAPDGAVPGRAPAGRRSEPRGAGAQPSDGHLDLSRLQGRKGTSGLRRARAGAAGNGADRAGPPRARAAIEIAHVG
jgi:hypothetical protein